MSLYLGLDLGTTKIAMLVYDAETNSIMKRVSFPHGALRISGQRREIEPESIKRMVLDAMGRLTHRRNIKGIGISTQMHGCLFVDAKNRPMSNLITWQDERCLQPHPKNPKLNYLEKILRTTGAEHFINTGTGICSGFLGPTVFWFSEQKKLPKSSRVCFLGDYIASILTGAPVSPDITDAGSSGFFDIKNKRWLWSVIEKLRIPAEIFPGAGEPGSVLGSLNGGASSLTGLSLNIPVLRSIGDNQASIIGSAGTLENTLLLNIGTGSAVSLKIKNFMRREMLDTRYFYENTYILVGAALCGGRALKLFRDFLAEADPRADGNLREPYEVINRLLKNYRPAPSGLLCGTFFAGTRHDPARTGFIAGIREENFHVKDFLASLLEGMLFELHGFAEMMGDGHYRVISGAGNAMRKNQALGRIAASLFNRPVRISRSEEEAALGAALLAARAGEKSFDIKEALAGIGAERTYLPVPAETVVYRKLYAQYKTWIKNY